MALFDGVVKEGQADVLADIPVAQAAVDATVLAAEAAEDRVIAAGAAALQTLLTNSLAATNSLARTLIDDYTITVTVTVKAVKNVPPL